MNNIICKKCNAEVSPLEIFPNDLCLACHSEWFDKQPLMTASDLANMFSDPGLTK